MAVGDEPLGQIRPNEIRPRRLRESARSPRKTPALFESLRLRHVRISHYYRGNRRGFQIAANWLFLSYGRCDTSRQYVLTTISAPTRLPLQGMPKIGSRVFPAMFSPSWKKSRPKTSVRHRPCSRQIVGVFSGGGTESNAATQRTLKFGPFFPRCEGFFTPTTRRTLHSPIRSRPCPGRLFLPAMNCQKNENRSTTTNR